MDKFKKIAIVLLVIVALSVILGKLLNNETPINKEGSTEEFSRKQMEEYIQISNLVSFEKIKSPLKLSGKARGNWFFEASAPVQVLDENGVMIGQKYITAEGEWMTTDFVPFSGEVSFTMPQGMKKGFVLFKKDNPSGDPKFDMSFMVPVRFE